MVLTFFFGSCRDFFERTILCNSLVWSCSLTGKSSLTYQEAVDSEKKALQNVNDLPIEVFDWFIKCHLLLLIFSFGLQLKQPLLLIASLTCRGKMNEACDDVYYFMKDRYFVDESVEAILRSKWYPAELVRVVPPSSSDLQSYKEEQDDELSAEDKLIMLDQYGPPPELFKYEVRELFDDDDKTEAGPIHTVKLTLLCTQSAIFTWYFLFALQVTVDCIRREKGMYSREKLRLYLRHCLQFDDFQGIWVVKVNSFENSFEFLSLILNSVFFFFVFFFQPDAWTKLKMNTVKYSEIFTGEEPTFEVSRAVKKANRSSLLSSSRSSDSGKTASVNGKGTPNKGTPKRGASDAVQNSKSSGKSPKLDAESLAQEFIKSVIIFSSQFECS